MNWSYNGLESSVDNLEVHYRKTESRYDSYEDAMDFLWARYGFA